MRYAIKRALPIDAPASYLDRERRRARRDLFENLADTIPDGQPFTIKVDSEERIGFQYNPHRAPDRELLLDVDVRPVQTMDAVVYLANPDYLYEPQARRPEPEPRTWREWLASLAPEVQYDGPRGLDP